MSGWKIAIFPLLVLITSAPAEEQAPAQSPLAMRLSTPVPRSRNAAPLECEIELTPAAGTTGRVFEGPLELALRDGRASLYTYRTTPLVVADERQILRLTLPPVNIDNIDGTILADAAFIDSRSHRRLELGTHLLPAVAQSQRGTTILLSDPWRSTSPSREALLRGLRLERFFQTEDYRRALTTFPARVKPDLMPAHPQGYCAYDIVALVEDGFALLSVRQLEALAQWLEAGGSAYIAPGLAELNPAQQAFLDRLRHGAAVTAEAEHAGVEMVRVELGRAVIDARPIGDMERRLDTAPWQTLAGFLWKIRAESGGSLPGIYPSAPSAPTPWSAAVTYQTLTSRLTALLRPREVRLVPLSALGIMLALFVLAIGPGDYLLLGLVRRRKLTWVFFPLLALAFTWGTVAMSNAYMGKADHRRALIIHDLGAGGRVLRQNRLELQFLGTARRQREDYAWQSVTPLLTWSQITLRERDYLRWPPLYEGRFPARYSLEQSLAQWSPRLCRMMSIAPEIALIPPSDLNWDAVGPAMFNNPDQHGQVVALLYGEAGADGLVVLIQRDQFVILRSMAEGFREQSPVASREAIPPVPEVFHGGLIHELTIGDGVGISATVSRLSPAGGDTFEDFPILDTTDPHQWALVVVRARGDDYLVERRLYDGVP